VTIKFATSVYVLVVIALGFVNTAVGQEDAKRAPLKIYDVPGSITVVHGIKSNEEHIRQFLIDFLGNDSMGRMAFRNEFPETMNPNKPIVFYGLGANGTALAQLPFDSRDDMLNLAESKPVDNPDQPFLLKEKINIYASIFGSNKPCFGMISGNHLFAGFKGEWSGPVELDAERFEQIKKAKLLNDSLDPKMLGLLNRAGITGLARPDDTVPLIMAPLIMSSPVPSNTQSTFPPEEEKLIKKIGRACEGATFGAVGLTYEKRQLTGEAHVKFSKDDLFKDIFDFEESSKSKFEPTVGLSPNKLLATVSIQTSIFDSPKVARIFQKFLIPGLGAWSGIKSDAGMFQLTSGLIADSWSDIKGVRIGLYHNQANQVSFVLIIDPRNPDEFLSEVEKLVAIAPFASEPRPDWRSQVNGLEPL